MHTTGVPAQTPFWQVSPVVQALPSLQVPTFTGFEHAPEVGSQVPATWHWSLAVHVLAVPLVQVPPWHASPVVHALLSLHGEPSVAGSPTHVPVFGSHVWALMQVDPPGQTTGLPPMHVPDWQVSVCVQALPSLQPVPSVFAGFEQTPEPGSQVPAVWH